jgi:hypothetical protein
MRRELSAYAAWRRLRLQRGAISEAGIAARAEETVQP